VATLRSDDWAAWRESVAAAALGQARSLLREWLPAGKVEGNTYKVGNINGDNGQSLTVWFDKGNFKDFSNPAIKGGNLVALYAQIRGIAYREANEELAERFGIARPELRRQNRWVPVMPVPDFAPLDDAGWPKLEFAIPAGEITAWWAYLNADGQTLFYRVRVEMAGAKQFRPITYCRNQDSGAMAWTVLAPPAPRPLYGLEYLAAMPDAPVLVVEGEKACDAARLLLPDWCCVTYGSSSISEKNTDWGPLLQRKTRIVIWPDNDRPGVKAASECALILQIRNPEIIQPSPEWSEGWDLANGLTEGWTTARTVEYLESHLIQPAKSRPTLDATDPMAIARSWATNNVETDSGRILHHWDERWFKWSGAAYQSLLEKDMKAELWRYLTDVAVLADQRHANQRIVGDVSAALEAHLNIPKPRIDPPCWIGKRLVQGQNLAAVENGILNLDSGELSDPTPHYFNLHHSPVAFLPGQHSPAWLDFLDTIWPGDPEQVETLQEMFGYLLAGDASQQKIFMIIGPARSGKGTIGQVIEALLGHDAIARPTSSAFSGTFGNEGLVGRSLAIISDMRVEPKEARSIVETLLSISGGDSINVERKYQTPWRGKLNTRFLMLTNELPKLWDAAGALPSRFIVLVTRISFLGKEDRTLLPRIKDELPGVLNWAIQGWRRLCRRGRFIQPTSAEELVDQFRVLSSPISEFVWSKCVTGNEAADAVSELADIYKAYKEWCEEQGNKFPSVLSVFARDLRATAPRLHYSRKTLESGRKVSLVGGIRLRHTPSNDEV